MKLKKRLISYEAKVIALEIIPKSKSSLESPGFVKDNLKELLIVGGYHLEGLFIRHKKFNNLQFRMWNSKMKTEFQNSNIDFTYLYWTVRQFFLPVVCNYYNIMPAAGTDYFRSKKINLSPKPRPDKKKTIPPGHPEYSYGDLDFR